MISFRCTKNTLVSQALHQANDLPDGGQVYDVYLEPLGEHRTPASVRAFHAMRDELTELTGMSKEYAKAWLKIRHGVAYTSDDFMVAGHVKMPDSRPGEFVEDNGRVYYVISTTAMTTEEMARLNRGVEQELLEVV